MTGIKLNPPPDFVAEAKELLPDLISFRRELHQDPEIGFDLPRTRQALVTELKPLGLQLSLSEAISSVIGVLHGSYPGPVVLLRADMDALPVIEETSLDYASTNGNMHACGHDLHVSALVGAARMLAGQRTRMAGSVIFMFEPGEEVGGGAPIMLREGLLEAAGERPIAAYGIHVLTTAHGIFSVRAGAMMAGANSLKFTVRGRGGHGSRPHEAVDPVPVLARVVLELQSYVSSRFNVFDPVVLSVTRLSASEARNVIPDTASAEATVRTLSEHTVERLASELPALVKAISGAHGCSADVEFEVNYPVTVNSEASAAHALQVLNKSFGADRVKYLEQPVMASEDFSFVLREVEGAFIFLGALPADLDEREAAFNHSPRAVFDDAVLGDQAAALAALAWSHVSGG